MAENDVPQDDRTEEATPERREEFRERGQLVVSRELTSVFVLASSVIFFTVATPNMITSLERLFTTHFEAIATRRINAGNIMDYALVTWLDVLRMILPIFIVTVSVAVFVTLAQTRMNWSWERLAPDFSRLNPMPGLLRIVNVPSLVELLKSSAKMFVVSLVAYLILKGEWSKVPELMNYPMQSTWAYWGTITRSLFWAVAGLLVFVAGADYLYNFISFERKIRMTKQEIKEEYKRREVDPHIKARMRRMQRDMATKKVLEKTRKATVLITNPTHYSIALSYELGDTAPKVLAKGVDFLALKMREIAKEEKIPIIENRPLARELYATVEEGEEVPDKFYRTIAEIIRYVFKLKGRKIPVKTPPPTRPSPSPSPSRGT